MDSGSPRNYVSSSKICRSPIFKLLHQDVDINNALKKNVRSFATKAQNNP